MRKLSVRIFALVMAASFATSAGKVFAITIPMNNWVIDPLGADQTNVNNTYANLNTNSPTIGNGTFGIGAIDGGGAVTTNIGNGSANSGIITNSFSTITLLDGETISLSGSMTIINAKAAGEDTGFQFGLMYNAGGPTNANGWLGYKADNSNSNSTATAGGHLRARTSTGTGFTGASWISSGSGRDTNISSVLNSVPGNVFSSGTYSFGITVTRVGDDLEVSGSIVGTGSTTFSNVYGPETVTAAAQKTFDFNRVGLWVVSPLDADQVQFSNINVSVVPEPTSIALLGVGLVGLMVFRKRR